MHVRVVFADMHKTHSTEYLLESLVDGESLGGVLTSLMVIAEKKAQSQYSNKVTVKQWSRAARRLKELREWCAKFGPRLQLPMMRPARSASTRAPTCTSAWAACLSARSG